jgi:hypothetical protein
MTILSWPTGLRNPSSVSGPSLRANTMSGGRSPFDGTEQTLELPGARWVAELRWNNLPAAQWRILQAFITSLRGQSGRFTWGPSAFAPRLGGATSAGGLGPRVKTAGQTGSVLVTTGWSGLGWVFEPGDWFGFLSPAGRPQLHMSREYVTNIAGDGTLFLDPPIRRSPNADEPLILTNPVAVWKLADDMVPIDFSQRGGPVASVTMPIEEAIWG